MTKIIAYIRTSTDKQELNNQKLTILEYAQKNNLKINEFVEIQMSSRKTPKQRRIEEVVEKLSSRPTLNERVKSAILILNWKIMDCFIIAILCVCDR